MIDVEGLPTTAGSKGREGPYRRAPRRSRRPPDRGRRDHHGQARDLRMGHGRPGLRHALSACAQSVEPRAHHRRLVLRLRRCGRRRPAAHHHRHRHRRLGSRPRVLLRRRRPQADLRSGVDQGYARHVADHGPCRTDERDVGRGSADARRDRRPTGAEIGRPPCSVSRCRPSHRLRTRLVRLRSAGRLRPSSPRWMQRCSALSELGAAVEQVHAAGLLRDRSRGCRRAAQGRLRRSRRGACRASRRALAARPIRASSRAPRSRPAEYAEARRAGEAFRGALDRDIFSRFDALVDSRHAHPGVARLAVRQRLRSGRRCAPSASTSPAIPY